MEFPSGGKTPPQVPFDGPGLIPKIDDEGPGTPFHRGRDRHPLEIPDGNTPSGRPPSTRSPIRFAFHEMDERSGVRCVKQSMTTLLLLLLLMTPGDGVQDLLRQLGEDDAAVRATAVEKLISRGRGIVPELQAALVGQSDPEVRARIAQVLRALTRVRWLTDLESGRRKAAQEKKPLVVFSTAGPLDGFV